MAEIKRAIIKQEQHMPIEDTPIEVVVYHPDSDPRKSSIVTLNGQLCLS
jgi:hypothetical protein